MALRSAEPQVAPGGDRDGVTFGVDGRDVVPGLYEAIAVAPPGLKSAAAFRVGRVAVRF